MRLQPNEAEFTRQVIKLAQLCKWRVAHFRPAKTDKGWRTAVSGDGVGFPDLILIRGCRMIAAELKVGKNKLATGQQAWLLAFGGAGAHAVIWRETDWPLIETTLA